MFIVRMMVKMKTKQLWPRKVAAHSKSTAANTDADEDANEDAESILSADFPLKSVENDGVKKGGNASRARVPFSAGFASCRRRSLPMPVSVGAARRKCRSQPLLLSVVAALSRRRSQAMKLSASASVSRC